MPKIKFILFNLFQPCTRSSINDSIRQVFQSFGDIESVQRMDDVESTSGIYSALVSFVHSECAFNVLVANHNEMFISEYLVSVMPADTWQQTHAETDESEPMDTCDESDEIKSMTQDLRGLSLYQKDVCCANADDQFEIDLSLGLSLKQIRTRIFSVKSHQKHLVLDYGLESDGDESDDDNRILHIDKSDFEKRASKTISKIGAKKFQALTIRGKDHISMEVLQWLEPLLKRLQVLYIETYSNSQILYALHDFCPNLSKLYFFGFKWRGDTWTDVKAWPKLTHFVLKYVQLNIRSETETGQRFQRFIGDLKQIYIINKTNFSFFPFDWRFFENNCKHKIILNHF